MDADKKSCLQCIKFNVYLLNKCVNYSGYLCSHLFSLMCSLKDKEVRSKQQ